MILRRGIILTDELRVLRLLCTVGPIPLSEMEKIMPSLKINTLTKMGDDGLILIENKSIKITEKGIAKNEETLERSYVL